ncbi:hypothetical protein B4U80_05248, partial [Leptotrombidium deliense]
QENNVFNIDDSLFVYHRIKITLYSRYSLSGQKNEKKDNDFVLIETAFKNRVNTLEIHNQEQIMDIKEYMHNMQYKALKKISSAINTHKSIKLNLSLTVPMRKPNTDETASYTETTYLIIKKKQTDELNTRILEYDGRESGWTVSNIDSMRININKIRPLKANSYIRLRKFIEEKIAIVNVQNKDNKCFMWAVLAALHPVKVNSTRVGSNRQYETELLKQHISHSEIILGSSEYHMQYMLILNPFFSP